MKQLDAHGQSVWIDFLSRDFVANGDLEALIRNGVPGVTSNPTIFQGAIAKGDAYDEQLRDVLKETGTEPKEVFPSRAVRDIQGACDLLQAGPLNDVRRQGRLGLASFRPEPRPRHCRARSREAKRLHELVDRKNLLVKIPATKGGPAGDRGVDRRAGSRSMSR